MSSSEDSDAGPKRKRKVRQLEGSPSSTSSGSPILANSSERLKRKSKRHTISSSEDSDGSPILTNSRKRMRRVSSDSESDSSGGSDIPQTRHGRSRQLMSDSESSQWETDFSDQEASKAPKNDTQATTKLDSDSELSDGQSEKCPICLVSFKAQEIGTPESCDHTFCLECIQEWSKNMNTCPVDRQEYRLILVRDHLNGKVTRQIPVEHTVLSNGIEFVEDLTYCEICGSSGNEDRMLLCDGCDLGYHLYCLTPPLTDVPTGYWYCNECTIQEDFLEISAELTELGHVDFFRRRSRTSSAPRTPRIMPRTRQTERVRRRVETNRYQSSTSQPLRENSNNSNRVTSTTSRSRRRRRKVKFRTVYVIDEATGETVAVQKRMKRKRKRKSRKTVPKPKTVKTRLAQQLGMCGPRNVPQNLPDVKIPNRASTASSNISGIRHSAGIPTLDLFGQNDDLDYFTDEENYSVGSQVLTRRAPNRSDVASMRRTIRQKNVIVPEVVSSTSDLLDSILTSQEQLYARNASYSIDSTGKFKIEAKSKSNNYIDVTKEQVKGKETPYYNPNRNRYNQNQNYRPYNRYQRPGNNYYNSNNQNYYNAEASSSMNYSNNFSNDGQDNDFPQDYSRRTLCATTEPNAEEKEEEQEESNQNDESELDIYSDIETVTTSKTEDRSYRPLSPPPMPNISGMMDDENNDSETDMVIDDEKLQEQENQTEYGKEETTVTSTVGSNQELEPAIDTFSPIVPTESNEIQSGAIQSSSLEKSYQYYNDDSADGCPNANIYSREARKPQEEDAESDDGCPNFSIYSKESKTMALHSGITLGPEISTAVDYQVGEISSSPQKQENELGSGATSEPVNPDQLYDPEQIFNEPDENGEQLSHKMDETSEHLTNQNPQESDSPLPQELSQIYDPEKDTASPIHDSTHAEDSSVLDHTYDPENCMRSEETLNTDAEKTLDPDQGYDPEKIYEENSNSNLDIEKEIYQFNSQNADNSRIGTGDRYDPALPFDDDANADSKRDSDNEAQNEEDTTITPNNETLTNLSQSDKKSKSVKSKRKSGSKGNMDRLYSDSEDDENIVKKDNNAFGVTDINDMTEDISEEERSYTPCLDEKSQKQGLEGLETELISDEDRNDFDEAQELKTVSDGDALEINAKESELDLARPEDYEEGEIVDKNKDKEVQNEEPEVESEVEKSPKEATPELKKTKKKDPSKSPAVEKGGNKENEHSSKDASFKRLSKSSKGRNYRDKEKRPSDSRNKSSDREYNKKEKRKERRKELERYNVRAIIAEKPRPLIAKDQFGRDIRNTPSRSRSRSYTPPLRSSSRPIRSPSKSRRSVSRPRRSLSKRKSPSKERSRKTRKARSYRSATRSRSPPKKRDAAQKAKKRKRSTSRFRKRKPDGRTKKRRPGSRSRRRSRTPVRRARERIDWTPMSQPQASPSWTPPRLTDNPQILRNDLTVTVNNAAKKKKDKRKKDRRNRDTLESRQRKRRHERERTPPPSKEVFASGDNILVSVSFNNENERRDVTTRDKRNNTEGAKKRKKKRTRKDLTGVKPIAIIDLAKSPFRELTPSPKQVIILTDSDNEENVMMRNGQGGICDSSQQVASPERGIGPKTPPEPQVKFSLAPKPPQIRAINNPLHDPEDMETNVQKEMGSRISPGVHKGPNTPPEPPNSPPSSPDAYDPFEPTKSRSPTPEIQQGSKESHESIDSRAAIDLLEKSMNPMPEIAKSLTPPLADIQPADSQSSVQIITPDSNVGKSPERPQIQTVQQPSKPVAQTIPFSSVPTPIISSTPLVATIPTRINILNTTVISPPVASPLPQRIVLPNIIKSGVVKISPTKPTVKTNPIKPIQNKMTKSTRKRTQNGSLDDIVLDFDSPYSPGSSDYEDLFEPPSEIVTKPMIKGKTKSHASAFDALFGSPNYSKSKKKYTKKTNPKTKTVGVKLDEDCLKILDDLPNSAVEMQVKDKFLKKLNRQERVVDEVKLVLKPHYNKKRINKEEYKDIMRRSVPKICHNRSGEINPTKIKALIEAYVRKVRHSKKVTSSSSVNPQKI